MYRFFVSFFHLISTLYSPFFQLNVCSFVSLCKCLYLYSYSILYSNCHVCHSFVSSTTVFFFDILSFTSIFSLFIGIYRRVYPSLFFLDLLLYFLLSFKCICFLTSNTESLRSPPLSCFSLYTLVVVIVLVLILALFCSSSSPSTSHPPC